MMKKRTAPSLVDHGLRLLVDYDQRVEYLPGGYWMKFEIQQGAMSAARPHGLTYSFTLHDRHNHRIIGFDNAHAVDALGRNAKRLKTYDHWHKSPKDKGRPYDFTDAATLLTNFFDAVEAYMTNQGYSLEVIGESTIDVISPHKRGKKT